MYRMPSANSPEGRGTTVAEIEGAVTTVTFAGAKGEAGRGAATGVTTVVPVTAKVVGVDFDIDSEGTEVENAEFWWNRLNRKLCQPINFSALPEGKLLRAALPLYLATPSNLICLGAHAHRGVVCVIPRISFY